MAASAPARGLQARSSTTPPGLTRSPSRRPRRSARSSRPAGPTSSAATPPMAASRSTCSARARRRAASGRRISRNIPAAPRRISSAAATAKEANSIFPAVTPPMRQDSASACHGSTGPRFPLSSPASGGGSVGQPGLLEQPGIIAGEHGPTGPADRNHGLRPMGEGHRHALDLYRNRHRRGNQQSRSHPQRAR